MRVVAYERVSTQDQVDGYGLEAQDEIIQRWARHNGHTIVATVRDEGFSGLLEADNRPGLGEALGLIQSGQAEGMVVCRMDRLARDMILQETLLREFTRSGAQVFSCSPTENDYLQDDPSDPARRLVRQVLGAVAEYERSLVVLRMKAGKERKKAAGLWHDGQVPFGYQLHEGRLVPYRPQQITIQRARELREEGLSLRDIAAKLKSEQRRPKNGTKWHPSTVARLLKVEEEPV